MYNNLQMQHRNQTSNSEWNQAVNIYAYKKHKKFLVLLYKQDIYIYNFYLKYCNSILN
jgi:hypothetical protein